MGHYRGRSRRSAKRGTVGRSGIWWLWIRSCGQTIDTPYTGTEALPLRARCHQRTGRWANTSVLLVFITFYSYAWGCIYIILIRGHGLDQHHYPNSMNHAGHAHTYSGPPPSALVAQMTAGHAPRGGGEHDNRGRTMMAYQGGTLGRSHHHHVPLPPPPTEVMNGGSMSLPPVDYR